MRSLVGAILVGVAAFWLARGAGIEAWRWWAPGDASDIGLWAAFGLYFLTSKPKD